MACKSSQDAFAHFSLTMQWYYMPTEKFPLSYSDFRPFFDTVMVTFFVQASNLMSPLTKIMHASAVAQYKNHMHHSYSSLSFQTLLSGPHCNNVDKLATAFQWANTFFFAQIIIN